MEEIKIVLLKIEDNSSSGSQALDSSLLEPPYQNHHLTEQQKERMELNKKTAQARQRARRQSQENHTKFQENMVIQDMNNSNSMPSYRELQEDPAPLTDCNDQIYGDGCSTEKPTSITLSKQQVRVLQAIAKGQSVFVTGSAGTGKSYLLGLVVKILGNMHGASSVYVTASTGIAACPLDGMTLHSFAGAIPGDTNESELLDRVSRSKKALKRWMNAKALVIDEISMIDGEFFDRLNYVANTLRGPSNGVWGGLQLVVTGDFFQLPPVRPPNQNKYFAFEADCWDECFDQQIELRHIFRQSDRGLVDILQEMRKGLRNPMTLARLNHCHGSPVSEDGSTSVVKLFPRNDDVRRENEEKLKALGQEIISFTAHDRGKDAQARKTLKTGIVPDRIGLCLGAQVMLIKNIETERKLVNGATGEIVDFVKLDDHRRRISPTGLWPRVKFHCGEERVIGPESWSILEGEVELACRTQVPLILAWALSVHKCQGMTLERVETDLRRAFDYGMVYVALSRVKNLDGLRLIGFDPSKIRAHPKVLDFYNKLTKKTMTTSLMEKRNQSCR